MEIPQIEKTIEYENKTISNVSYLQKAVLVAGAVEPLLMVPH